MNKICKVCKTGDWLDGNHLGKPLHYKICMMCWDDLTKKQRDEYIKDGVVPITTSSIIKGDSWHKYCAKFGMTP